MGTKGKKPINVTYFMISIIFDIYIYILYIYIYYIYILPRNAIAALLCQKAIFSMLRRNSRSDIVIIFWATSFSLVCVGHVEAQRQRCALKLAQCLATWVRVF